MKRLFSYRTLLLILALTALAGCSSGGGGGGGEAAAPTGSSNWDSMKWDQDNWG